MLPGLVLWWVVLFPHNYGIPSLSLSPGLCLFVWVSYWFCGSLHLPKKPVVGLAILKCFQAGTYMCMVLGNKVASHLEHIVTFSSVFQGCTTNQSRIKWLLKMKVYFLTQLGISAGPLYSLISHISQAGPFYLRNLQIDRIESLIKLFFILKVALQKIGNVVYLTGSLFIKQSKL